MVSQPTASVRWTTSDLEFLPQNEWTTYEIIDGELFVTRSPHMRHQDIALEIAAALNTWSKKTGLGKPILSPGIILSDADNIIPDAVWVSKERVAVIQDESGHLTEVPELLIEVLSAGSQNISRDRKSKLKLYSVRGAEEYWIIDRFTQRLEVYRRESGRLVLTSTLTTTDTLTSPLLPDFSCPVSQLFSTAV